MPEPRKNPVDQHIERCIEMYGNPYDEGDLKKPATRESYEQLRADLMLAVGMLTALNAILQEPVAK